MDTAPHHDRYGTKYIPKLTTIRVQCASPSDPLTCLLPDTHRHPPALPRRPHANASETAPPAQAPRTTLPPPRRAPPPERRRPTAFLLQRPPHLPHLRLQRWHLPRRPRRSRQATCEPDFGSHTTGGYDGYDERQRGDDGAADADHGLD